MSCMLWMALVGLAVKFIEDIAGRLPGVNHSRAFLHVVFDLHSAERIRRIGRMRRVIT